MKDLSPSQITPLLNIFNIEDYIAVRVSMSNIFDNQPEKLADQAAHRHLARRLFDLKVWQADLRVFAAGENAGPIM